MISQIHNQQQKSGKTGQRPVVVALYDVRRMETEDLLANKQARRRPLFHAFFLAGAGLVLVVTIVVLSVLLAQAHRTKDYNANTPMSECPWSDELDALKEVTYSMWRTSRVNLATRARTQLGQDASLFFLVGNKEVTRNNDVTFDFRQDSTFLYLTGANMPEYSVAIYSPAFAPPDPPPAPITTLFVPAPTDRYAVWYGNVFNKLELKAKYDVNEVMYTNELELYLSRLPSPPPTVYSCNNGNPLPSLILNSTLYVNSTYLDGLINTARTVKSAQEVSLLLLLNKISSYAHESLMKAVAARVSASPSSFPSDAPSSTVTGDTTDAAQQTDDEPVQEPSNTSDSYLYEYELESYFKYLSGVCGARDQAYPPIIGSGPNGAVLHYIANDRALRINDLVLVDAGAEYLGYASDISRTFPVNGKFSPSQTVAYNIVRQTQMDVIAAVRPDVSWATLNTLTRTALTSYMQREGLLKCDVPTLLNLNMSTYFLPHSVGHTLGLDVHDTTVVTLRAGNVITIEPGLYFNDYLLQTAQNNTRVASCVSWDRIDAYRNTGGIRIEDDLLVTSTGYQMMTTVPSDIPSIQALMAGQNP
eukprot:TRINITY_DN1892_c0_g1_i2.p1 TRINITY_DN1892_c0_g1~~TRINITY_DN1892_c0_g1_i2.p1  ORF type:complete len:588 (-),score=151.43 TRINITY_DN1892_c0_g1_i2:11-1774(-)